MKAIVNNLFWYSRRPLICYHRIEVGIVTWCK